MYYPNNDLRLSNVVTKKDIANKMEVCQRKMERKMLGLKQIDRIPNSTIKERTKVDNILKVITKTKWKWAGHVARMNNNRWTVRCRVASETRKEVQRKAEKKMA